jgi:glutamate dehydrogenase
MPDFYKHYVKSVHHTIEKNAELEFECLWREHKRTGIPRAVLSDEVSFAIVKLNRELQQTSLWDNLALRRLVLMEALPRLLQDIIPIDNLMQRIPIAYLRAIFGAFLASRFVYQYGIQPSQFAFFEFMSRYFEKLALLQQ